MEHLVNHPENSLVKEGRIELVRRGLWRMKPVMHKDLLPKEFLMSLFGLDELPKQLIKSLKITGDYSYRSENEKEIGGVLVFAPLMGAHKSGIINRASEHDFLFSDPYWLREIFARGLREGMVDEQDFRSLHRLPFNEKFAYLGRLWNNVFGNCECFATVFWFNPQKLLTLLQTKEEGHKLLKSSFRPDVQRSILKDVKRVLSMRALMEGKDRYSKKRLAPLPPSVSAILERRARIRKRARGKGIRGYIS